MVRKFEEGENDTRRRKKTQLAEVVLSVSAAKAGKESEISVSEIGPAGGEGRDHTKRGDELDANCWCGLTTSGSHKFRWVTGH